jgi:hypothetical protein
VFAFSVCSPPGFPSSSSSSLPPPLLLLLASAVCSPLTTAAPVRSVCIANCLFFLLLRLHFVAGVFIFKLVISLFSSAAARLLLHQPLTYSPLCKSKKVREKNNSASHSFIPFINHPLLLLPFILNTDHVSYTRTPAAEEEKEGEEEKKFCSPAASVEFRHPFTWSSSSLTGVSAAAHRLHSKCEFFSFFSLTFVPRETKTNGEENPLH